MVGLLKPSHFHDLGKLSLAFVMLWAYFNFSQYMLVYSANLVEEIPYIMARTSHGWQYLAPVPRGLPLRRAVRAAAVARPEARGPPAGVVAIWLLVVRYVDLFMMVSPEFSPAGRTSTCSASTAATSSSTGSTWRRRGRRRPLALDVPHPAAGPAAAARRRPVPARRARPAEEGTTDGGPAPRDTSRVGRRPVLATPPGAGYEHTDANTRIIAHFLFWLGVGHRRAPRHVGDVRPARRAAPRGGEPEFPLAVGLDQRQPPEPRLQQFPLWEYQEFRGARRRSSQATAG
jgi:hypothetical protein